MPKRTITCNIFIASPGDVDNERQVVHNLYRELNDSPLVKGLHIRLEALGWEQAMPQAGDPQEIINRLAADCDLLICLFHRRFGSPTTSQPSGTLEEFLNAYDRWKANKKPQIFLYFKQVAITSKQDLEDQQLIRVMDFKKQVQNNRLVLYKDFKDTDEFTKLLKKNLEQWISTLKPQTPSPPKKEQPQKIQVEAKQHQPSPADEKKNKQSPAIQTPGNQTFCILHLSDLHVKEDKPGSKINRFDRNLVFSALLKRLKKEHGQGKNKPELVVVSGDIAFAGKSDEYQQAGEFFNRITQMGTGR